MKDANDPANDALESLAAHAQAARRPANSSAAAPQYFEAQLKKYKRAVTGAGVATILLGVLMLGAFFLLRGLAKEGASAGMYRSSDVWAPVVACLVLTALGIGVLRRSIVCLSLATLIAIGLLAWNLYVRVELGLGTKMIGTLAFPLVALIAMVRAFGPISELKAAKRTMPPTTTQGILPMEARLSELDSLRQKGLISDEEHAAKRRALLEQL